MLIKKDLIENENKNFKASYENEKHSNLVLVNRVNELESDIQAISAENSKLKDKESFSLNEVSKYQTILIELKKVIFSNTSLVFRQNISKLIFKNVRKRGFWKIN